jgi:hypothetical protein
MNRRNLLTAGGVVVALLLGVGIGVVGSGGTDLQRELDDERRRADGLESQLASAQSLAETATDQLEQTLAALDEAEGQLEDSAPAASPAQPSGGRFSISYGEWDGLFSIENLSHGVDFDQTPKLTGTIEYLGGGDCDLGYVEVEALFYDSSGDLMASGFTNWTSLPEGRKRGLDITTNDEKGQAARADVTVVDASCV